MFLEKPLPKKKRKGFKDYFDFRNNLTNQVGLIFFSAFVIGTIITNDFNMSFSQKLWEEEPAKRYKLANILIDSEICIGKTMEEVKSLLGQPGDYELEDQGFFSYYLGNKPSFSGGEKTYLILRFENGRVSKVFQEHD